MGWCSRIPAKGCAGRRSKPLPPRVLTSPKLAVYLAFFSFRRNASRRVVRRALGRCRVLSGERDPAADVAQLVEQLPCKQQVTSSSLVIGSRLPVANSSGGHATAWGSMEGYRSGQTGQTVNLLA